MNVAEQQIGLGFLGHGDGLSRIVSEAQHPMAQLAQPALNVPGDQGLVLYDQDAGCNFFRHGLSRTCVRL